VKDVRILYLSKSDRRHMARWKSALESERFMKGITVAEFELSAAAATRYGRRARA
jgi:hypothetical protein